MYTYNFEENVKGAYRRVCQELGIESEIVSMDVWIRDVEDGQFNNLNYNSREQDAYNGKDEVVLVKSFTHIVEDNPYKRVGIYVYSTPKPNYKKMYEKAQARIAELEEQANYIEAGE